MWAILSGTLVNGVTVCVGSLLGLSLAKRLPERYRVIVLQCLGLVTITLGIDAGVLHFADTVKRFGPQINAGGTYGARLAMVMIGSLLLGALLGTALRLHERIESLGDWIHRRFSSSRGLDDQGSGGVSHGRFAEGFLTASVIFCVGPLTLLGCLQNGASGDPSLLYIKATLDGFCSMALASALGWGVLASVVTVVVFQGGLSLLAALVANPLNDLSLDMMTVVGGVVLLATALMILEIKKIQVANLLPSIFLPPLLVWVVEWFSPGLLLPLSVGGS